MKKNDLISYAILIVIAAVTTSLGLYIGNRIKMSEEVAIVIKESEDKKQENIAHENFPSQFPDFDAIKGERPDQKIKNIKISSDCSNDGCTNNKPATIDFDGIKKDYLVRGQFSRAYLYIDSLVDYNRPLTSWDDIYFTINEKGGHLIPDGNQLPVPAGNTSKYLYNLNSTSFFPTIKDKEQNKNKKNNVNLFGILKDGNKLSIHTSVSSNRPGRVIKDVSIFYECFEGSDCSIEEIKK